MLRPLIVLKGQFTQKYIWSSITHPHAASNLTSFVLLWKTKGKFWMNILVAYFNAFKMINDYSFLSLKKEKVIHLTCIPLSKSYDSLKTLLKIFKCSLDYLSMLTRTSIGQFHKQMWTQFKFTKLVWMIHWQIRLSPKFNLMTENHEKWTRYDLRRFEIGCAAQFLETFSPCIVLRSF